MDLRIEQLRHTYRAPALEDRTVLNIAEWQISAGRQVLLRGISGSGKTTLLNILAGLLPPTNGTVWVGEQSLYALRESQRDHLRARAIGYVFQMHHLVPTLSALENVEMPLMFGRRLNGPARRAQALALLADVGLGEFSRYRPVQLSTGQRLRVAVARALAAKPAVVLADEPTAALDAQASANVIALIQDACRRRGASLIVASHDPALASRFDCVVDLHGGMLYEQMSTARQKQQIEDVRT
jgi:ABC-type lipoprotein export system ATPase subunit